MIGSFVFSGSALEGGAVFKGEGQAAIRVGRGVVQQATPELFAEGSDLAVLLFQNPEEVLHRAAPVPDVPTRTPMPFSPARKPRGLPDYCGIVEL